ncbi:HD domain-containing protein [Flavobacteriaceae bacterium F08102]|nr:HD domain-containing protein [Flavobacteriaceae bacterium F08102]
MNEDLILKNTIQYVKKTLRHAEGGHDWFHIERVFNNCKLLLASETGDRFIVLLGALLHDIADSKFHNGDETLGPQLATSFLRSQKVPDHIIEHIVQIINNISFKSSLSDKEAFSSPELSIVQDADRLDAIGAIGIARCFNYGGFKNRALYNPAIKPKLNMTKEAYKNSTAPSINHFYEKLLLLKDKMNTETGRKIAYARDAFMRMYLAQFMAEWEGKK